MKKILLFVSALAGLFLAASCQQENLEPEVKGGVTYEISLPTAPQTKGEGGYTTYDLHYEVYKTADADALATADLLFEKTVPMEGNTKTLTLDLLNDQDYTVLFWANKSGANTNAEYFDLTDLRKVKVKTATANNDNRDAFCGMDQLVQHDGAQSKTVELKRPFAQINIATLVPTVAQIGYDVTPTHSYVKVSSIPKTFNVFTGLPTEEATVPVEFSTSDEPATVPTGDLEVNGSDEYDWVAMNYILVPESVVEVYYEITTKNGVVKNTIPNVPVKKNYRTNIIGNLLTSKATYTIQLLPGFEEGDYYGPEFVKEPAYDAETKTWTVTNADELAWVAASVNGTIGLNTKAAADCKTFKGETVVLANDIDLKNEPWTPIGYVENASCYDYLFAGTFDGQGHSIKNLKVHSNDCAGLFGNMCGATVKNVTIDGFELKSPHYAGAIVGWAEQGATPIVVENCKALNGNITVNVVEIEEGKHDLGDKAGAIVGFSHHGKYIGNEAKNVIINGYRDLGGILGYGNNSVVTGNKIENVTLIQNLEFDYKKEEGGSTPETLDDYIGRKGGSCTITDNTGEVTEMKGYAEGIGYDEATSTYIVSAATGLEWIAANVEDNKGFEGQTIILAADVDLFKGYMPDGDPITTAPIGDKSDVAFKGTFDGAGHTIKNLYQNGWALNYEWGVYGSIGLFRELENATVKNVVIEDMDALIEGGDISFIAGSATGDCVFENITINSSSIGTYNNGCGGIIGWSGEGTYTFKDITIGEDVVLGGLWGSFDSSIGGVVGQAEPGATYNFENVTVNCRIDAYNDCTASYDYYNYRMCGMVIGRCKETTTINGVNYPDLSKYNMTFNNVVVNYGDWMNYHYCRKSGERAVRVEPGYAYGGISADRDHSTDNVHCMDWIPFNQLIGGNQYAVKGLPTVEGVTVNYPESFYREQGYKADGNTWTIYSGEGFKHVAANVLNDGAKNVTIELANDIDLAGIEWPVVKTAAAFVLDGKGKSIKNLTTTAVEDHGFYSTAMFTSTRKAATIKNVVVENATVTGKGVDNSHGAVLVACNYAALNIEGVTVKNSTVSNCDRTSVIATYLYFTDATVKNCVVEGCTVNSIGTAGALLGMNNSKNFEAVGNTVKNTTVSSSEGSNKAGILIGTWQSAGTLTESNNVVENSKAINAGTETNNNIGRTV